MMHYGFGHFGGRIYMILFWILLIVGVVYLISRSHSGLFSKNHNTHRRDYRPGPKEGPKRREYETTDSELFEERDYRNENINRDKSAEEIAKERYAKGEIDKEEYKDILKEINR